MTLTLMHPMFQVSSFNQLLQSLFTQLCLENPRSHIVVLAKPKLQRRDRMSHWNLEVFARVPRLESNYVSICKLQPLHFVTGNFWRNFNVIGGNFAKHVFVKCPQKNFFDGQNGI